MENTINHSEEKVFDQGDIGTNIQFVCVPHEKNNIRREIMFPNVTNIWFEIRFLPGTTPSYTIDNVHILDVTESIVT